MNKITPSDSGLESKCSIPLVKPTNGIYKGIFFTINPSDTYWTKYNGLINEKTFRTEIIYQFDILLRYYNKKRHLPLDAHIHFENANGRVHSHGVIIGELDSYYPYEGELKRMSLHMHKVFGKPRLNSGICADFRWTNDQWDGTYINKQNYMKPCRIIYKRT